VIDPEVREDIAEILRSFEQSDEEHTDYCWYEHAVCAAHKAADVIEEANERLVTHNELIAAYRESVLKEIVFAASLAANGVAPIQAMDDAGR
jgi:predicted transcriptional regulator